MIVKTGSPCEAEAEELSVELGELFGEPGADAAVQAEVVIEIRVRTKTKREAKP